MSRRPAYSLYPTCLLQLGDWACAPDSLGNPSVNQAKVAKGMAKWDPDFVIAMGDNFYERGIESVDDARVRTRHLK